MPDRVVPAVIVADAPLALTLAPRGEDVGEGRDVVQEGREMIRRVTDSELVTIGDLREHLFKLENRMRAQLRDYVDERVAGGDGNGPTEADIASPEFQAVWSAIKGWDIQRSPDRGYAGANGDDVMTILNALRAAS